MAGPQTTAEYLREARQARLKLDAAQREADVAARHVADLEFVSDEAARVAGAVAAEQRRIIVQIRGLKDSLRRLVTEVKEGKSSAKFVERVKTQVGDIEQTISAFKAGQADEFSALVREEGQLWEELRGQEQRIESWPRGGGLPAAAPARRRGDAASELPPEVREYETYLTKHGPLGGWDETDHQAFLRVRTQYKGREEFTEVLSAQLVTRSEEEVRRHETWFRELTRLKELKKATIAEWKSRRVAVAADDILDDPQVTAEEEQRAAERRAQEEAEAAARKEKLEGWRREKERRTQQLVLEEMERQGRIQEEKAAALALRQEKMKNAVAQFREEREAAAEREYLLNQVEREAVQSARRDKLARLTPRIQERNEKTLAARQRLKEVRDNKDAEKAERMDRLRQRVAVEAPRDPDRLLRPTSGWESRQRSARERQEAPPSIFQVQQRAVPSWRSGV